MRYIRSVATSEEIFRRVAKGKRKFVLFTECGEKDFKKIKVGAIARIENPEGDKLAYICITEVYRGPGITDDGILCLFDRAIVIDKEEAKRIWEDGE